MKIEREITMANERKECMEEDVMLQDMYNEAKSSFG